MLILTVLRVHRNDKSKNILNELCSLNQVFAGKILNFWMDYARVFGKSEKVFMTIPAKGLITILALELLSYLVLNALVPRKAST